MARRDLTAFFDEGLDYPGVPSKAHPDGKDYRVPSPDAETGLWLTALANVSRKAVAGAELDEADVESLKLNDEEELTFYQRVLGSAYTQMLADGVPWLVMQRIGRDAYLYFAMSEQSADAVLADQGKAQAPNRAARRATPKKTAGGKSRRASTDSANPTSAPASPASSTSPTEPEAARAV